MKLIFASDSFKGSLSAEKTAELLAKAAKEVFTDPECLFIPTADGGEGTLEAVRSARGGELITVPVTGPCFETSQASYLRLSETEALIEMSAASGLPLVPPEKRDPRFTTTYGTGELVMHALSQGASDITLTLGGSATNDGGTGFLSALGFSFTDASGNALKGAGEALSRIVRIDAQKVPEMVRKARFKALCDVKNPLTGPDGATFTFGPQKGGSKAALEALEAGMKNYRKVLMETFGKDPDLIPGAGAAGGMGAALCLFLNASLTPGIEAVLDLVGFDEKIRGADAVITGEGRTDWQSFFGKVIQGVGDRAKKQGIPVYALCGSLGEGYEKAYEHGIVSLMTTVDAPMNLDKAMERAEELYYKAALRLFRFLDRNNQMKIN